MQLNRMVCGSAVFLATAFLVGFVIVRPVSAQEQSATTTIEGASASAVTTSPQLPPPPPPPPPAPLAQTSAFTGSLVEVQLQCSMSYTAPLYDTPSGHLDAGYFLGTEFASTTGMTGAHEIGEQAWTVCHDFLTCNTRAL